MNAVFPLCFDIKSVARTCTRIMIWVRCLHGVLPKPLICYFPCCPHTFLQNCHWRMIAVEVVPTLYFAFKGVTFCLRSDFTHLWCHHAGVWLYAPRGDLTRRPSSHLLGETPDITHLLGENQWVVISPDHTAGVDFSGRLTGHPHIRYQLGGSIQAMARCIADLFFHLQNPTRTEAQLGGGNSEIFLACSPGSLWGYDPIWLIHFF